MSNFMGVGIFWIGLNRGEGGGGGGAWLLAIDLKVALKNYKANSIYVCFEVHIAEAVLLVALFKKQSKSKN